ncbi:MAG: hypothetical protein ACTSU9_01920 [Promethearchaeota archaeon]
MKDIRRDIRRDIIEAIKRARNFWLFTKRGLPGFAGNLDLLNRKLYIEVLLHPADDDNYPCSITIFGNTRGLTMDMINEYMSIVPGGDRFADPASIISGLMKFKEAHSREVERLLEGEITRINDLFDNQVSGRNQYRRIITLHMGRVSMSFPVEFQNYPFPPTIHLGESALKVLKLGSIQELTAMKNWKIDGTSHVVDVIAEIGEIFTKGNGLLSQVANIKGLDVGKGQKLNVVLPRGSILGIMDEGRFHPDLLRVMYAAIQSPPSPESFINVFGNHPGSDVLKDSTVLIDDTTSFNSESTSINKLLKLELIGNKSRAPRKDLKALLLATNLVYSKKERVGDLKPSERLRLACAVSIARGAMLLLTDLNSLKNRLEFGIFERVLKAVANQYHASVIVTGPGKLLSKFDKILTISEIQDQSIPVSLRELQRTVDLQIILLQVQGKDADPGLRQVIAEITGSHVVEEVTGERYKIFVKKDAKNLLPKLCEQFNTAMYKLNLISPDVNDYLQYNSIITRGSRG